MRSVLASLLLTLRTSFRARLTLQLEILALRHQLQVLERSRSQRIRLTRADRLLWVWISRVWDGWRDAIMIVKPETVVAWQQLPTLLDVEAPTPSGSTRRSSGRPPIDSHDGGGQPVVGRAAYSR
jgi:hypothetical protein